MQLEHLRLALGELQGFCLDSVGWIIVNTIMMNKVVEGIMKIF